MELKKKWNLYWSTEKIETFRDELKNFVESLGIHETLRPLKKEESEIRRDRFSSRITAFQFLLSFLVVFQTNELNFVEPNLFMEIVGYIISIEVCNAAGTERTDLWYAEGGMHGALWYYGQEIIDFCLRNWPGKRGEIPVEVVILRAEDQAQKKVNEWKEKKIEDWEKDFEIKIINSERSFYIFQVLMASSLKKMEAPEWLKNAVTRIFSTDEWKVVPQILSENSNKITLSKDRKAPEEKNFENLEERAFEYLQETLKRSKNLHSSDLSILSAASNL